MTFNMKNSLKYLSSDNTIQNHLDLPYLLRLEKSIHLKRDCCSFSLSVFNRYWATVDHEY